MSGATSRRKGHDFERYVAIAFKHHIGEGRRGLQYRDGTDCPDVIAGPYWVECKRGKSPAVRAALRQARRASNGSGKIPLTVIKDDRASPFVCINFDDFLGIAQKARTQETA